MTIPSLRVPWAALLLLSSRAWAEPLHADATHPWPWPTVEDIRPDNGTEDTSQLLEWLVSPDEAQRAEAQIRLLAPGETLLPQLEAFTARLTREEERERIQDFLYLLSLRPVGLAQLLAHPTLSALGEEGVARGLQLVAPWKDMTSIEGIVTEARGGGLCGNARPDETLYVEGPALLWLRDELRRLGARAARPALAQLWSSSSPAARMLGLALASQLRLPPEPSVLERLSKDEAQVGLVSRNYPTLMFSHISINNPYATPEQIEPQSIPIRVPISRLVFTLVISVYLPWPSLPSEDSPLVRRIEARSDLWFQGMSQPGYLTWASGLMRSSKAMQARDEQEYWNLVRPLWRAWWRGSSWARRHPEGLGWYSYATSYQGYQYFAELDPVPYQTVLKVMGTVGTEVELTYYNWRDRRNRRPLEVYRGVIPFTVYGRHGARYRLRVRTALSSWQDLQLQQPEVTEVAVTLWLNPALRRAYLEQVKDLGASRRDR